MMPDSRTLIIQNPPLYSTSESGAEHGFFWIQEPIGRQPYDVSVRLIVDGIYVRAEPNDLLLLDSALADEFSAWEAASDEALLNFENENL
jgi:hypothetical protein